jgi:hypothetical protein
MIPGPEDREEPLGRHVAVATLETTLGTPAVTAAATEERVVAYLDAFFRSFLEGTDDPVGTGGQSAIPLNPELRAGKSSSNLPVRPDPPILLEKVALPLRFFFSTN